MAILQLCNVSVLPICNDSCINQCLPVTTAQYPLAASGKPLLSKALPTGTKASASVSAKNLGPVQNLETREPLLKGRLSTVDLLVQTISDQMLFIINIL